MHGSVEGLTGAVTAFDTYEFTVMSAVHFRFTGLRAFLPYALGDAIVKYRMIAAQPVVDADPGASPNYLAEEIKRRLLGLFAAQHRKAGVDVLQGGLKLLLLVGDQPGHHLFEGARNLHW